MNKLPEMTVEKRKALTPHGVLPPDVSKKNMAKQCQQAIQLNEDAKTDGWQATTLEILREYIPIKCSNQEIMDATYKVTGLGDFKEVSKWVKDDMCLEFFNRALQFCLREGQSHKKSKGFIDGSGIGYVKKYIGNLKDALEKTFDAKWYYKTERPLAYIQKEFGMDLSKVANEIHPGHWTYPQGHSTKSYTAVQTLKEVFNLDKNCLKELIIAASVFGHGRDGNLIHFPMDCEASIPPTGLDI